MEMVPYTGKRPSVQQPLEEDWEYEGVVILVPDEHMDDILDKIESWFDDRDEIILVDNVTSAKGGNGIVILEWEGVRIDPLFLKILYDEERVSDYAVYLRGEL